MPRVSSGALFILIAAVAAAGGARANDSAAELAIGGLRFTHTRDVVMESEDLRISLDAINVRYSFRNVTAKPVTLTVAFPLPDIDLADDDNIALPFSDPVNFVGFATKIDGVPADFRMEQRARLGAKDVTASLQQFKLPLLPIGPREIRIADLPAATRDRLADEGLLAQSGQDERGRPLYAPGWVVTTSVVRQQTFPPGRSVVVEHAYKPSVGTSSDTVLRRALRRNKAMNAEVARYRKDFCVSDAFLAELDRKAGGSDDNRAQIQERRISYILKTGANWATPIKSFKLTIDPGASDRLVSFCHGRLKASADGREFTTENFTPDADLRILVLGRFK